MVEVVIVDGCTDTDRSACEAASCNSTTTTRIMTTIIVNTDNSINDGAENSISNEAEGTTIHPVNNIDSDGDSNTIGTSMSNRATSEKTVGTASTWDEMSSCDSVSDEENTISRRPSSVQQVEARSEEGFLSRQARRMANRPKLYLWTSFLIAVVITVIAFTTRQLNIDATSTLFLTRGTDFANGQAQAFIVNDLHNYLNHSDYEQVWCRYTTGSEICPDHSHDKRSLTGLYDERERFHLLPWADTLDGRTEISGNIPSLPKLFDRTMIQGRAFDTGGGLTVNHYHFYQDMLSRQCDIEHYTSIHVGRLWPVWRSTTHSTLFGPDALNDICMAEESTLQVLKSNGLCEGCESHSECLPPLSIVLLARLSVPGGLGMSCQELSEQWPNYRQPIEEQIKICLQDMRSASFASFVGQQSLPESCPLGFSPHMVDLEFEDSGILLYTSTLYITFREKLEEVYKIRNNFDRGDGSVVIGNYDTQNLDFYQWYMAGGAISHDMLYAVLSAVFVIVAMMVHTRSVLLTAIGLLQIIFSIPVAYFFYSFAFGYSSFPVLNFVGVFVSFAVGCDDVFLAVDKWKNARLDNQAASTPDIAASALPDASKAMLMTTFTTSFAFFSSAISPVTAIRLFGIFVGISIVSVYLLCILFVFPCLCMFDEGKVKQKGNNEKNICCQKHEHATSQSTMVDTSDSLEAPQRSKAQVSFIRRVMSRYHQIAFRYRLLILLASISALVVSFYGVARLEAPGSIEIQVFDESNEFEQCWQWRKSIVYFDIIANAGATSFLFWGLQQVDTGDHDDPTSKTLLALDNGFDLSSSESQEFFFDFCEDLFLQPFATPVDQTYVCLMTDFNNWLGEQHFNSMNSTDSSMSAYDEYCNDASGIPLPQEDFNECFTAWVQQAGQSVYALPSGRKEAHVPIIFFPFRTSVGSGSGLQNMKTEFDRIESWIDLKLRGAPEGITVPFVAGLEFWYMETLQSLTSSAYASTLFALAATTAVLLVASKSISVTFISVTSIVFVLTMTVSTIVALGWTLGFMESVCMSILIGLSADYVTHLSAAYISTKGKVQREVRMEKAVVYLGPSIIASAFTTAGAGFIMIFTVLALFEKFAYILMLIVLYSVVGTFGFFVTMMNCLGPTEPGHCQISKNVNNCINRHRTTPINKTNALAFSCNRWEGSVGTESIECNQNMSNRIEI